MKLASCDHAGTIPEDKVSVPVRRRVVYNYTVNHKKVAVHL